MRWYFERFQVQPMRVNITLDMNPIGRDDLPLPGATPAWQLRRFAASAGFPLVSIQRAPLRLNR